MLSELNLNKNYEIFSYVLYDVILNSKEEKTIVCRHFRVMLIKLVPINTTQFTLVKSDSLGEGCPT